MPNRKPKPPRPDHTLAELLERAETIKRTSDGLIRQMNELAAQIQEAKARAEDQPAKAKPAKK